VSERLRTLLARVLKIRYAKFGIVGASGTVVNIAVLYVMKEFVFEQLYVSLAVAIVLATANNFSWNRLWTWADRNASTTSNQRSLRSLFGRYVLASWLGIALQYGLTLWLAHHMDYRYANLLAIGVASISNFIANDRWTFRTPSPDKPF
jgi:dolichol-phosphate mannosyltransferase